MSNDTFQWTPEFRKEFIEGLDTTMTVNANLEAFRQSKIPKKEWEIVGLRINVMTEDGIFKKAEHLFEFETKDRIRLQRSQDELINCGARIHAVHRLSDNEVFCIGDLNEYPTGLVETITGFKISEEIPSMMLFTTDYIWSNLNIAKKATKPKKERIEVERIQDITYGSGYKNTLIVTTSKIDPAKYEAIKAVIEKILNDD